MTTQVSVGHVDEIPVGEGRTFAIDGEQIAVYRMRDGSVRALSAVCPHRGGPLADGLIDDQVVVCPLHGLNYDLETGREVTGTGLGVCTHAATVDATGAIRVALDCGRD
ncbi:MAG: Rieske 2Fe-2S domain-containing protein [Mycolicibacterium sp.]|jgi:nitrite reductase (NADH) small subunit|nr:Rieske 2Fe-2S domain-containing protein [Mycolicibacterium sp.]